MDSTLADNDTTQAVQGLYNQYGDLRLPHGQLRMPFFMPDATQGVVRSLAATDLLQCDIQAVVMNTFHLMQRPGSSTIQALGGLHKMSGWQGSDCDRLRWLPGILANSAKREIWHIG